MTNVSAHHAAKMSSTTTNVNFYLEIFVQFLKNAQDYLCEVLDLKPQSLNSLSALGKMNAGGFRTKRFSSGQCGPTSRF